MQSNLVSTKPSDTGEDNNNNNNTKNKKLPGKKDRAHNTIQHGFVFVGTYFISFTAWVYFYFISFVFALLLYIIGSKMWCLQGAITFFCLYASQQWKTK